MRKKKPVPLSFEPRPGDSVPPSSGQWMTPKDSVMTKAQIASPFTEKELELHGMRSASLGGYLFCGVSEEPFAINGVTYQWPRDIKTLYWGITFSRLGSLSEMDCKDALTTCFKEIEAACDRKFEMAAPGRIPNIEMSALRLDGASGVLAQMQIPVGNVNAGTKLRGEFDDGENWVLAETPGQGTIDFYRVALHELLHAMGLGHKPVSITEAALIAPIYSRTLRNLQKLTDIAELIRRYGEATSTPAPVPPTPGAKPIIGRVSQGEKVWEGVLQRIK